MIFWQKIGCCDSYLIYFLCMHFITCPSIINIFKALKTKVLTFTDNFNRIPPVSDTPFFLGDFSASCVKLRTGIWTLSVVLFKVYSLKISEQPLTFDSVWNWAKEDIRIANMCHSGPKLDEAIFEEFDIV